MSHRRHRKPERQFRHYLKNYWVWIAALVSGLIIGTVMLLAIF